MAYNPYDPRSSTYNTNPGQQYGGQTGSRTPESQSNAAIQGTARAHDGSPLAAFGNAANQWHGLLQQYMQAPAPQQFRPAVAPGTVAPVPGNGDQINPPAPRLQPFSPVYANPAGIPFRPVYAPGALAHGGDGVPTDQLQRSSFTPVFAPPVSAPAGAHQEDPGSIDNRDTGGGGGGGGGNGPVTPPPPQTDPPITTGTPPQPYVPHYGNPVGIATHAQTFISSWAQQPGYEWLASSPQAAEAGQAYLDEVAKRGGIGENGEVKGGGLDFPDFLEHYILEHPSLAQSGAGNPLYKRSGTDTYGADPAHTTPAGTNPYPNDNGQNTQWQGYNQPATNTNDPFNPANYYPGNPNFNSDGTPKTGTVPGTGLPPAGPNSAPTQAGTPLTTDQSPSGGNPATPTGTIVPKPVDQSTVTTPGSPVPGVQPLAASSNGDVESYLRKLMQPTFSQEQNDYMRQMRAQGALTGQNNSGGFNESLGRGLGSLVANEGSTISNYLQQSSLADKQLAMQKYSIDTNEAIAKMDDETKRLGIRTNDDLQRWLNDPNNNTLQKYQIDKNDVLDRYKAQLALQGQTYSANAQMNAAAMNAAVQQAGIEANVRMAAQRNQLEQKLGQQNYDLGVLGINGQNYRSDQSNIIAYLQMLANMDPAARMNMPPLPGYTGY